MQGNATVEFERGEVKSFMLDLMADGGLTADTDYGAPAEKQFQDWGGSQYGLKIDPNFMEKFKQEIFEELIRKKEEDAKTLAGQLAENDPKTQALITGITQIVHDKLLIKLQAHFETVTIPAQIKAVEEKLEKVLVELPKTLAVASFTLIKEHIENGRADWEEATTVAEKILAEGEVHDKAQA